MPGWLTLDGILHVTVALGLLALMMKLGFFTITRGPTDGWHHQLADYEQVPHILNGAEYATYRELRRRFGNTHIIACHIRIEDVIRVRDRVRNPKKRAARRRRIKSRHFDFVILTPRGKPVLAIEYDGPSHNRRPQMEADRFKDALCKKVGLNLVRLVGTEHAKNVNNIVLPSVGCASRFH